MIFASSPYAIRLVGWLKHCNLSLSRGHLQFVYGVAYAVVNVSWL